MLSVLHTLLYNSGLMRRFIALAYERFDKKYLLLHSLSAVRL